MLEQIVSVVDDDEAVRDSVALLLECAGFHVRRFGSAAEFLDSGLLNQPGCLVLDVRMPGMSGLELMELLQLRECATPVIFLSGHGDIPMAVKAVKAGAADFIEKPFRHQELVDSVRTALDAEGRARLDYAETNELAARRQMLTERERQVMDLAVQGLPNKIIAIRLGISYRTVEIHRAHVMDKMQAGSLSNLLRMALRLGTTTV